MKIKLNIRKQPILLLFIATLLQCFLSTSTFAQNLSLKNANGNGALFDGTSITHPELSFNSKTIANMTSTPIAAYDEVYVSFALKPTPSKYRYNGKVYTSGTLTGKCVCDFGLRMEMKMTATVNIEGKTYTGTVDKATIGGVLATRVTIKLPGAVKSGSKISITSITVEALSSPHAEEVIRRYEKCLQNEKEQKEAAEKEKAKKETTKTDDDFWSGGKSETEKKEMTIVAPTISNDDFWSGKEEKPKMESEKKDEKEEKVKEEQYCYTYLTFWNGYLSDCSTGKDGIRWVTNIFKVPYRAFGNYSELPNFKGYLSEAVKKSNPELSNSCVKAVIEELFDNYRGAHYIFYVLYSEGRRYGSSGSDSYKSLEDLKSRRNAYLKSTNADYFIEDFYPYGK